MQRAADFSVLFIDFNSYFASVEQQDNPDLRHRPVAVAPLMSEHTCAIAASYEAKAFGVKTGTKIHEARRLCPGLVVVPARHDRYVAYHQRLMEEIGRHAPIEKVCSIDEAYCRLLGTQRSALQAVALAKAIKAGIASRIGPFIRSSIGIAATPLLAKIASDLQKPDGLTLLPLDSLPGQLSGLRLSDLPGIGANMDRRLKAAGIYTINDLWALAPKQAKALWGGVGGERFWYELHGFDIPDTPTTKRVIGHSRVLSGDMRHPEMTRLVARALLLKAARRLRRYDFTAGALVLGVRERNGWGWGGEARFALTQDSFVLLRHLERLWRSLDEAREPHILFKKISITLHGLMPLSARSRDLFDETRSLFDPLRTSREVLWHSIDRLDAEEGRPVVRLASQEAVNLDYLGTKIAFTRIPDAAEFTSFN